MDEDPWLLAELDLPGYLERVGVPAGPPDRDLLDRLHEAHVRAFPFENIDVLLDQHPGVALPQVQAKFLAGGRGGYCFEHGTLFAAVLERLGFVVRRQLGRVGDVTRSGRTHLVVVVTLDGAELLADPGFGMSIVRPIRLADGHEEDQDGWRYRVQRLTRGPGGPGWALDRLRGDGWEVMHSSDDLLVQPVDVAMGHHFTSTHPASHFTRTLTVARHAADRHTTVTHEFVTVRRPGQPTEHRPLRDGELPERLVELGVRLPADQLDRLLERVRRMRAPDPLAARPAQTG